MFYASMVESERPIVAALNRFTVDDLMSVSKAAASRILMRKIVDHLKWSSPQVKTELASYLLALLYENLGQTSVRGTALFKKLSDKEKTELRRTLDWGITNAHSSKTFLFDVNGNERIPLDLMFEAAANEQVYRLLMDLQEQLESYDQKVKSGVSWVFRSAS